jgi:hypothetical protein
MTSRSGTDPKYSQAAVCAATHPGAGPVCAHALVAQGSRAQIDKIAAGPIYSAAAAAEHGEVAKMPAELVENEASANATGLVLTAVVEHAWRESGRGHRRSIASVRSPAPPHPGSPGVPPTAGSASRTRQQTRQSPGERRLSSGMVVAPGTDRQTKEVPPWT